MTGSTILTTALFGPVASAIVAGSRKEGHDAGMATGTPSDADQGDRTVEISKIETGNGPLPFRPTVLSFLRGRTIRVAIPVPSVRSINGPGGSVVDQDGA